MVTIPQVRKSGGLIGAELSGLDLTREYPDPTYQAILRAWAEHGVIFLRDQHLDADQRDAFASKLGEIRVRQELRKEPEQTKAVGEGWHTDMTCFDEPPKATILFCQEVPPWGGDTQWAAMDQAGIAAAAQVPVRLRHPAGVHHQVPLGARVDRDVGQPADLALRGQRLPGAAPRDAPHPAERIQAGPGRLAQNRAAAPPASRARRAGGGRAGGVRCRHDTMSTARRGPHLRKLGEGRR